MATREDPLSTLSLRIHQPVTYGALSITVFFLPLSTSPSAVQSCTMPPTPASAALLYGRAFESPTFNEMVGPFQDDTGRFISPASFEGGASAAVAAWETTLANCVTINVVADLCSPAGLPEGHYVGKSEWMKRWGRIESRTQFMHKLQRIFEDKGRDATTIAALTGEDVPSGGSQWYDNLELDVAHQIFGSWAFLPQVEGVLQPRAKKMIRALLASSWSSQVARRRRSHRTFEIQQAKVEGLWQGLCFPEWVCRGS